MVVGRTIKRRPRTIKVLKQTGKKAKSQARDEGRKALAPGKRVSKAGNIYWETRKTRSDRVKRRT